MWKKRLQSNIGLALVAGTVFGVATLPFTHFWPLLFLFGIFLTRLGLTETNLKRAFWLGFLVSLVINIIDFYWVTYVIHVFGNIPWAIAGLLFLGFCGFAALNFAVFLTLSVWIQRRLDWSRAPAWWINAWFGLGLPALFTVTEYWVPKLFPFYLGHGLYGVPWLTQTSELGSSSMVSFMLFSVGSTLGLYLFRRHQAPQPNRHSWVYATVIFAFTLGFSLYRLQTWEVDGPTLQVALVQANIGSLEKRAARKGIRRAIDETLDRYEALTEEALRHEPRPQLVVWPETAVPFQLAATGPYPDRILNKARQWNVAFITGSYAPVPNDPAGDYNAAYLLESGDEPTLRNVYHKHILLAFGEYMPFGETFPWLYRLAPAVSHFAIGKENTVFQLRNGTRLGITICYEDIVPEFYRRVAAQGVQGVVNLTNDSWFGPTAEPLEHGSIATFRAIETRMPMIRVTNTGISFTVDSLGRMSEHTPVYEEAVLHSTVQLPAQFEPTFYVRYGAWFIWLSTLWVGLMVFYGTRKLNVSLSLRD